MELHFVCVCTVQQQQQLLLLLLFSEDFSDARLLLLLLFSGSCRITVTGSNLNVSHTTKFLMSSDVDSIALNVMLHSFPPKTF